jgi:hypothetical protein
MRPRALVVMGGIVVALGAVYLVTSRPAPAPQPAPRTFVWSVAFDEPRAIGISLPRADKSQAWVIHEDKYWYFDAPQGPRVDMKRWGGGIPLLLSGPGAERVISRDATDAQLATYGLANPRMRIRLDLKNGRVIEAEVGDAVPAGGACYIRLAGSREVYTVDRTWYDVLARLVLEPPYPATD